jgi:hypothetical protein
MHFPHVSSTFGIHGPCSNPPNPLTFMEKIAQPRSPFDNPKDPSDCFDIPQGFPSPTMISPRLFASEMRRGRIQLHSPMMLRLFKFGSMESQVSAGAGAGATQRRTHCDFPAIPFSDIPLLKSQIGFDCGVEKKESRESFCAIS